jgi:hypothetical protein
MRTLIPALAVVGLFLVAFGYWGVSTVRGRQMFDEMAGMIPMGVGALGGLCLAAAIFMYALGRFRS